jgi:pimeloyl-ACP methyl ester carboxylesterase
VSSGASREHALRSGRKVCSAEYGVPDGVPVVFFQGTPSTQLMHPPESVTTELGVRLIVLDRPGFGGSEPAPHRTLIGWAEDVGEVLDGLGVEAFRVTGISGGGPYVLATACRWPGRVLSASVCGGSGPLGIPGTLQGAVLVRRVGYLLARHAPWVFRRVVRRHVSPVVDGEDFVRRYTTHNPPSDQELIADPAFRAMYLGSLREAYRQGADAFADEVILVSRSWGFDLRDIHVPLHLWHGELDTLTPLAMSRAVAARVPGCRLTVLPRLGHMFVFGPTWRTVLADLCG